MYTIGLDLGQRQDYSAIAVVERRDARRAFRAKELHSLAVRAMVQHPALQGQCTVVVDATGVGAPVVDLLRAARLGCDIAAVTITAGERAHAGMASSCGGGGGVRRWNVPKRYLISEMEVLLERGRLRIARRAPETDALLRELMDMRATQTKRGRVRLGADGCGQHDDLVIALALACWRAKQGASGYGEQRLPGL